MFAARLDTKRGLAQAKKRDRVYVGRLFHDPKPAHPEAGAVRAVSKDEGVCVVSRWSLAESRACAHAECVEGLGDAPLAEIKNEKDFEEWLHGKPREVSVALAARAALRVLPVGNVASGDGYKFEYIFPIFVQRRFRGPQPNIRPTKGNSPTLAAPPSDSTRPTPPSPIGSSPPRQPPVARPTTPPLSWSAT
ncbi:MAG: hypothetical protein DLM68_00220 [Hyphomicrobiales bacterium]|nr:MAG: hypothetical protein DLM68_00220 [Hyphomicrobiales bacterium]